jgi:hypothetical protein
LNGNLHSVSYSIVKTGKFLSQAVGVFIMETRVGQTVTFKIRPSAQIEAVSVASAFQVWSCIAMYEAGFMSCFLFQRLPANA